MDLVEYSKQGRHPIFPMATLKIQVTKVVHLYARRKVESQIQKLKDSCNKGMII